MRIPGCGSQGRGPGRSREDPAPWETRAHQRDVAEPRLASKERLSGAQDPALPVLSLPASRVGCKRRRPGGEVAGASVLGSWLPGACDSCSCSPPTRRGGGDEGKAPGRASGPFWLGPTRFPSVATGRVRDGALPASPLTDRCLPWLKSLPKILQQKFQ